MKAYLLSSLFLFSLVSSSTHRFDPEAEDFGYVNPKPSINEGAKLDAEKKFVPVS